MKVLENYRYLGVNINDGLDWNFNTVAVYRKMMTRLYFLRKLRFFTVCCKMLEIFYQSEVAGVPCTVPSLWFVGGVASEPVTPTDLTN